MSDYDEGWHAGMQTVLGLAHKRIEDLEEKLLSATMDSYDMAKYEYRDRIEELEAKLAKAVETISLCRKMQAQFAHPEDPLMVLLDTTIAELKGPSQ